MADSVSDDPDSLPAPTRRRLRLRGLWAPVPLAVLAGLGIGALMMVVTGNDPVEAYTEMLKGAFVGPNLVYNIAWCVPLVGMTMAAALPLRGGMVNLGGDGQLVLGGLAATIVALDLPVPGAARLVLALVAALLAGGAYAALAAWGQVRWHVPMLISTLLLNYPAKGFASFMVRFPMRDPTNGNPESHMVESAARLPELFGGPLSSSLVLMIVAVALIVLFDRRTVPGYELRMRGLNARFAGYGGVDLDRQAIWTMFAGGAMAGLVGAGIVLGEQFRFTDGALVTPNYTWTGLMAALLANGEPVGATVAAIFFASLQIGGFGMERATSIPRELTSVLQSIIILLLAARAGLKRHLRLE
jgi:simple sugar transport system permease protein